MKNVSCFTGKYILEFKYSWTFGHNDIRWQQGIVFAISNSAVYGH